MHSDLVVEVNGVRVGAYKSAIPPFHYEKAGIAHLVCDRIGTNWTHFPDKPGSVFFLNEEMAQAAADALNAAYESRPRRRS